MPDNDKATGPNYDPAEEADSSAEKAAQTRSGRSAPPKPAQEQAELQEQAGGEILDRRNRTAGSSSST